MIKLVAVPKLADDHGAGAQCLWGRRTYRQQPRVYDPGQRSPRQGGPTLEPTPIVNAFGECSDPLILWHGLTGTDGAVFAVLLEKFVADNPDVCSSFGRHSVGHILPEVPHCRCSAATPPIWSFSMPRKSTRWPRKG